MGHSYAAAMSSRLGPSRFSMSFRVSEPVMRIETYAASQHASALATLRRAALVAVCAVLVAVLGVVVPYKAYKYFKARQDAATVSVVHEEL